jgi:predicted RNA binding protein YcfA (HicA-like mRNA interferase family)
MKRRDWIKILERNGWYLERKGAKHDIYTDGTHRESVSRQREIDEDLIKRIKGRRGLK